MRRKTAPVRYLPLQCSLRPGPTPHLEAGTRSLRSLCSLHLPAVGIDRGSSAPQGFQDPPGLAPVPPARALGTDMGRCGAQAPAKAGGTDVGAWKSGRTADKEGAKKGTLTNEGQELPDVSCQVPIHDLPVEYVLGQRLLVREPSGPTILPRFGEQGPSGRHSLSSTYHL